MVENGQVDAIRQMTYAPVGHGDALVETMTFDRLRELNDGGTQRADFHVLALVDGGRGSVTVDFRRHRLGARSAVWVAPGAVHRWDDVAGVAGHLVLFVPTAPVTPGTREVVAFPDPAARWSVPDADWPFVDAARNHLLLEVPPVTGPGARAAGPPAELPGILLSALLARLRPPHGDVPSADPASALFRLFRAAVEADFRQHHDAGHYARALGYAPRTLSRAVQRATGRTAKAYLVERIVLEAKRLLAHDRLTAAGCAAALGFPDASNFSVFFRNATGARPGAWQSAAGAPGALGAQGAAGPLGAATAAGRTPAR
jgi:AraC-like DNA-binding protein